MEPNPGTNTALYKAAEQLFPKQSKNSGWNEGRARRNFLLQPSRNQENLAALPCTVCTSAGVSEPSQAWHSSSPDCPPFPFLPLQSLLGNSCYFILFLQPVISYLPTVPPGTFKQHLLQVQGVRGIPGHSNKRGTIRCFCTAQGKRKTCQCLIRSQGVTQKKKKKQPRVSQSQISVL